MLLVVGKISVQDIDLLTNNRLHARPPTPPRRRWGTNRLLAASEAGDESFHNR